METGLNEDPQCEGVLPGRQGQGDYPVCLGQAAAGRSHLCQCQGLRQGRFGADFEGYMFARTTTVELQDKEGG